MLPNHDFQHHVIHMSTMEPSSPTLTLASASASSASCSKLATPTSAIEMSFSTDKCHAQSSKSTSRLRRLRTQQQHGEQEQPEERQEEEEPEDELSRSNHSLTASLSSSSLASASLSLFQIDEHHESFSSLDDSLSSFASASNDLLHFVSTNNIARTNNRKRLTRRGRRPRQPAAQSLAPSTSSSSLSQVSASSPALQQPHGAMPKTRMRRTKSMESICIAANSNGPAAPVGTSRWGEADTRQRASTSRRSNRMNASQPMHVEVSTPPQQRPRQQQLQQRPMLPPQFVVLQQRLQALNAELITINMASTSMTSTPTSHSLVADRLETIQSDLEVLQARVDYYYTKFLKSDPPRINRWAA